MKRSEINAVIREMETFIAAHGFHLPNFCRWTPEDWQHKGHEYDEIRDNMLGWDITDYGLGDFSKVGFGLITLRSGSQHDPRYPKVYAEKLLYLRPGMTAPLHFHRVKSEDIINRGGGVLRITLYSDDGSGGLSDSPVTVRADGRCFTVSAGTQIRLEPGDSITLRPHQYHDFHVEAGSGPVLIGEVSQCNDDNTDNRFYEPIGRFPQIEEDEAPYRLLCNEYPPAAEG